MIGDGALGSDADGNPIVDDSLTVGGAPDAETGVSAPSYDDKITGGDASNNDIYGDYVNVTLTGNTTVYVGGSDTLKGGDNDEGLLFGDLDDLPQNNIVGDAEFLILGENTKYTGGVDDITGGTNADNSLFGDVFTVTLQAGATFKGGDDVITGGNSINGGFALNNLYGDAQNVNFDVLGGTVEGGSDRLVSGTNANDIMRGDFVDIRNPLNGTVIGGADTFVFSADNGSDTIIDFHVVEYYDSDLGMDVGDTIELKGFGFTAFANLSGKWTVNGNDFAVLDLDETNDGAGDIITFNGIANFNDLVDSFDFT